MSVPESNVELSGLKRLRSGKVRDIYELEDSFLMVTSDRISAFDVVLPDAIPGKGRVLTQLSLFWFDRMKSLVDNHLISGDVDVFPKVCEPHKEYLRDRSMWVKKAEPLAIECVVRGYISGSGWKSYKKDQTVCGIALPAGLTESDRLPEPIFTPSTKADVGDHDINISFGQAVDLVGRETAERVRDLSLAIYKEASEYALERGIIIADTKFEFGFVDGKLILIDEVLTPDSSRFWPQEGYRPGGAQQSFDKQFVRDYLETLDWNKEAPGPRLPEAVIRKTAEKYEEALFLLSGQR
ncbi:phosphoribosylaminoimidazolesuccinocarboxamide synthase [Desulfobotulus sp.]|jgi:phosphoribosylaminoimidazole-succinocarboxamide synthase|uniref:phosphoribosylaminoimidazolesuccinocarboxamide synthase n=1 Tax=Desulfobotulus sp. TaxID=1940337 RepID=UPI002A35EB33|nr:phosphoribosylaminoimidazolesuccinocarboxamide synthase [Desulfobotulus sp.]MDY0161797.1 phosphoribosylaminoimidazolesuccinocarboxamide synthase [Desulfobotulus sp.]